jgi:hypothetical protein
MKADQVFQTLDGPTLMVSGQRWRVEVFSVFDDADDRWIQIGLEGPAQHYMLTLLFAAGAGPEEVFNTLKSWLARRNDESGEIVNAIEVTPEALACVH